MMKLQGGLLQWSPSSLIPSAIRTTPRLSISACVVERNNQLTARERRQLRNERRESRSGYSWKEEVEERLIKKPKKRYASWTEELNLDTLSESGQQWWVVRVSRVRGHETAQVLARALARQFPEMEFTVKLRFFTEILEKITEQNEWAFSGVCSGCSGEEEAEERFNIR